MAITLRTVKGSALTHSELDANFTDITSSMVHSGSISGTTLTLHKSGSNLGIDLSGLDTTVATGSLLVTGSVSNNVLTFTKGDGSTFNLTVDTGSGGGTDTNIANTSLNLTGNRTLDLATNNLSIDALQGETFTVTADNSAAVLFQMDSGDFKINGLPNTETPLVVGYNSSTGILSYYSTASFSGGGGLSDNFYTADGTITGNRTVTFSGFGNYIVTGSLGTFQVYTNEVLFPLLPDAGGNTVDILAIASNGRLFKTGSDAFSGGSTSPGGSDGQVQYNNGGSFGGESTFTYDDGNNTLTIQGATNQPSIVLSNAQSVSITNGSQLSEIQTFYSTDEVGTIAFVAEGGFNPGDLPTRLELRTTNDGSSSPTTKMTIKNNGRVGIGVTSPTNGFLEVNGNVSGTSIYASANIVAYSDARSKTNVTTIESALDKIDAIRGVTYNKVEDPDGIRYMGVIAQELQEVLPEVVAEGEDGRLAVAYGNIVGVLIEAVKELRAEIAELKANK